MIVDDEPLACRLLSSYVERTESLTLAGSFTSASRGLEAINSVVPDIAFLDIQMPEMSGIELAGRITAAGTRVVFTTAYPDFALEGFRVNALHYLLKPISYSEFLEAVGRAAVLRPQSGEERYITVKSEYRLIRICVRDILYIEGLKDYIKIYTDGEPRPVLTLMSMKAVEALLPQENFMRVHRSYIANTGRIRLFEQGRIVYGDARIPVSDSCRAMLMERLQNPY